MADIDNFDCAVKACNLLRTIPVGDGEDSLWKYMKVDTRIGRQLDIHLN
ncbi:MAG: hypothetical protein KTR17_03975 [Cellvibrionaceae bacterium]|nr:hypothetical protein [Cellvibrionaceae bacterium]